MIFAAVKCNHSYLLQRPLSRAVLPLSQIDVDVAKVFVHYLYKVMGNTPRQTMFLKKHTASERSKCSSENNHSHHRSYCLIICLFKAVVFFDAGLVII